MITIKLLILGNSGVGKTSLLLNATEDNADIENIVPTIGVDFKCKEYFIDSESVRLQLWDTAGQERFKSITQAYYRGSHGIMVVYDITDEKSFQESKSWISTIKSKCDDTVTIILVANKIDMEQDRKVTYEEGKNLADEHSIQFIELSAFNKEKLGVSFKSIVDVLYEKYKERTSGPNVMENKLNSPPKKSKCSIT